MNIDPNRVQLIVDLLAKILRNRANYAILMSPKIRERIVQSFLDGIKDRPLSREQMIGMLESFIADEVGPYEAARKRSYLRSVSVSRRGNHGRL